MKTKSLLIRLSGIFCVASGFSLYFVFSTVDVEKNMKAVAWFIAFLSLSISAVGIALDWIGEKYGTEARLREGLGRKLDIKLRPAALAFGHLVGDDTTYNKYSASLHLLKDLLEAAHQTTEELSPQIKRENAQRAFEELTAFKLDRGPKPA